MLIQGQVQAPSNASATDGNNYTILQGKSAELIFAELHGKYWTQTYRGNMFSGATAQGGIAVPSSTSLSPTFVLWNPAASNVLTVPTRIVIGLTGTTQPVSGTFGWAVTGGAGSAIGTAAPFTAFAGSTPVGGVNLLSGQNAYTLQKNAQTKLAVAGTNTLTNLPSVGDWLPAQLSSGSAAATLPSAAGAYSIDMDGQAAIAPGTAWSLCFSNAAGSTASVVVAIKWIEIPL